MNVNQSRNGLGRQPAVGDPDRIESLLAGLADRAVGEGLLDVGYGTVDSPLGRLLVAATSAGVVRVGFKSDSEAHLLGELARRVSARLLRAPRLVDDARGQLAEYFDGRRRQFEVSLDWRLSAGFRRRVLRATALIPYGETGTYREVATAAGRPRAVRAAGGALAATPLPIIVPCHRVLRSDGTLGGYRGGPERKARLLALEAGGRDARA